MVRPFSPGDEEEIVHFLRLPFEGWPSFDITCSPLDHWKWKFVDNPLKLTISSLCVKGGEIIGCFHGIPRMVKIGDRLLLCASGADAGVHPSFRGFRFFSEMDKLAKQLMTKSGVRLFYAVSSNPVVIKYYSAQDYVFARSPLEYVRIRDVSLHLKTTHNKHPHLRKYVFGLQKVLGRLETSTPTIQPTDEEFRISRISSFDDRIEDFWNIVKSHYGFIIERRKNYMNWRYCDSRGGDYTIRIAEKNGEQGIMGYIITRINNYQKDYPVGYVVDLLTLPQRLDVGHALMRDALRDLDEQKINTTKCLIIKGSEHERVLTKCGFFNSRRKIGLVYRPHATISQQTAFFNIATEMMHFVYGDYDDI
jgi:hypothetical protein